jgi:hypothetical protein
MRKLTLISVLAIVAAACGGGATTGAGSSPQPTSSITNGGPARAVLPGSCDEVKSFVDPYVGGIATTKSLGAPLEGVSCEFANATASTIVILNMGLATPNEFAALRSSSGGGGRTITTVSGLGTTAFEVSKDGKPGGMAALSSNDVLVSVTANVSFDQDRSLIQQLLTKY